MIEKRKIEKESKNKSQHLGFVYSNTLGCPHCVYTKFENCSTRCSADKMEKLFDRKKKWTNKVTDKPYVADSFIHSTTCHT